MKKWLLSFLISTSLACASEFRFQERLQKAKSGDYIVTEANKMITLVAIRSSPSGTIVFEEISAPQQNLKGPVSWAEWVKAKAPGHTSWTMIEIDPKSGEVLECYSFSRAAWIQLSSKESLFPTLLRLPLHRIDPQKQRRIGPPPSPGEADHRKIWNPPLVFEGKKIEEASFDVFETSWPEDKSELSGKTVTLYFDKEKRFPLPFWIQVDTSHATAALHTIDAGKNLPSLHRTLPRRIPEFIGNPQRTENGLRFSLKSPKYYTEFELFAVDVSEKGKTMHPLPHLVVRGEGDFLNLEIDQNELAQTLEAGHKYTWLLVPIGHTESYTESLKPFLWSPPHVNL